MDSEFSPTPKYNLGNAHAEIRAARANVEALRDAFDVCPLLDENGNSECDFVEQIYRQKEERYWFARESYIHVNELIEQAGREISDRRYGRAPPERGHDPDRPAIELGRHESMLEELVQMAHMLRQALNESDRKRYPGMKRWRRKDFGH